MFLKDDNLEGLIDFASVQPQLWAVGAGTPKSPMLEDGPV